MQTTLTLDDDVAAKLKAGARRSGRSFRDTVNETLQRGLADGSEVRRRKPFSVVTRDLGNLRPDLSLDSIADVLDQVEDPLYR